MRSITTTEYPILDGHHQTSVIYENGHENKSNHEQSMLESYDVNLSTSNVFAMISFAIIILTGAGVNIRLFKNVKNETHREKGKVIQQVMKTYAMVQIIAWPCIMLAIILFRINRLLYGLFHPCLVTYVLMGMRFLFNIVRIYIGLNSIVVAVCRYLFIVCDEKISNFGIQRFKRIIIGASFWVPVLLGILREATVPWVHTFDIENQSCSLPKAHPFNEDFSETTTQSPIYTLTHNYVSSSVIYGIRLILYTLILTILSNTVEGILYLLTFRHTKRYTFSKLQKLKE